MTSQLPVGLDKVRLRGIRAIDNPSGEIGFLIFGTVFMMLALINALHRLGVVCVGLLGEYFDFFTDFFDRRISFSSNTRSTRSRAMAFHRKIRT